MIIVPVIWASFDFRPCKRLKIYFQNFYIVFKIKKNINLKINIKILKINYKIFK